jgi:CarD family transcriptional regulator
MQFKVGDAVVHPQHGLGHIVNIEEKRFSEKGTRLYYQITLSRSTLWIPVEAQETIGLRLATTRNDLDRYRHLLKNPPVPLDQNHSRRQLELAGRFDRGSFQGMCELVRDLTAWSRQKRLATTDATTLQKARESLSQEWATAAGLSLREANKEIDSLLRLTVEVGDRTKLA